MKPAILAAIKTTIPTMADDQAEALACAVELAVKEHLAHIANAMLNTATKVENGVKDVIEEQLK